MRVGLEMMSEEQNQTHQDMELILSAHPSGNAIGGACWKIEYNKQMIVYAIDMNDVPLNITVPMMRLSELKNSNILITNGYLKPRV
jgi:Cft2 family RNA processing exonuclease